jgi:predicted O-linked N-acetylglucosamine transferase (SPINDLY family)
MDPIELYRLATRHHKEGDLDRAEALYQQIAEAHPDHPQVLHRLAMIAYDRKDLERAVELFRQAIARNGTYPSFHNNLGNALRDLKRADEAEACYRQALRVDPNYAVAYYNLGALCRQRGDAKQALRLVRQALQLDPNFADAHGELGYVYSDLGQYDEAIPCFQQALKRKPDFVEAYLGLGHIYIARKQMQEAIAVFQKAARIKPDSAAAHLNLGALFLERGQIQDAERLLRRAEQLDPENPHLFYNLGLCLRSLERFAEAQDYFMRALAAQPDNIHACYDCCKIKAESCDWTDRAADEVRLISITEQYLDRDDNQLVMLPWILHMFDTPPELHARMVRHQARLIAQRMAAVRARCRFRHGKTTPARLRIGYVSPDFRAHAVGALIHDLFRHHDRSGFEIFGYALVHVEDDIQRSVRQGCDAFVNLFGQSPEAAAQRIHQDGIHILIDMAGHTAHARTEIFALEPAPVQAHYLGYLNTMGADFLPYILADPVVIPPEQAVHYTEKIVYLPDSFTVASPLDIAETPSRQEAGLPEEGPVFSCFNNAYKIEPAVFDVWMRILRRTPGSVLWISRSNDLFMAHLRAEAARRDIDPARLIEAPRLALPAHLARSWLADLFLDTFIYNAGSTGANMLWAGVPVLTLPGDRFLARMGASLLRAAGLPELVCATPEEYEDKAVHLVTHPDELAGLRARLTASRDRLPLFDLPRFARHLEDAYRQMWDQYLRGARETVYVSAECGVRSAE